MENLYEIIVCGKSIFLTKEEYAKFKEAKPNRDFLNRVLEAAKIIGSKQL